MDDMKWTLAGLIHTALINTYPQAEGLPAQEEITAVRTTWAAVSGHV